jgi:hypothetical protein
MDSDVTAGVDRPTSIAFVPAAQGITRCMPKPDEQAEVSRDAIAAGGKV